MYVVNKMSDLLSGLPVDESNLTPDDTLFLKHHSNPRPIVNTYSDVMRYKSPGSSSSSTWKSTLVRVGIFYILAWVAWLLIHFVQPVIQIWVTPHLHMIPIRIRVALVITLVLFALFMGVTELYQRLLTKS
jgi:hypothetical protein